MSNPSRHGPLATLFARAHLAVLERGWLSSNNVLFAAPDGEAVLVDSGYAAHAPQTVALVRRLLGAARRLDRVVNTHLHSDHCGGNAALQAAWNCAIDVPAAESDAVDRWDEDALTYRWTGQHCPRFTRTGAVEPGAWLTLGGRRWQAIASPGHDPRSFVLHEPELGILISADALWERGFGIVFPEFDDPPRHDGFTAVRATLAELRRLEIRAVIPGHGAPFDDAGAALDRAEGLLDRLEAEPERHARHAAKVLLKYHLMEVRAQSHADLLQWSRDTPGLEAIRRSCFGSASFDGWIEALLAELIASGAARREGAQVVDA